MGRGSTTYATAQLAFVHTPCPAMPARSRLTTTIGRIARLVWVPILLSTFAASIVSYYSNDRDERAQSDRLAKQISARLNEQLTILEGVRALILISDPNDDGKVRAYLRHLQTHARIVGIQGIGMIMRTTPENAPQAQARMKALYGPSADIRPASQAELAYPIVLIEPFTGLNRQVLGFDMYQEPVRRRAIQRAAVTGDVTLSGIVPLVRDKQKPLSHRTPGFLIYLPVIEDNHLGDNRSTRASTGMAPAALTEAPPIPAFLYAAVRIADLVDTILAGQDNEIQGIEIFSGPANTAQSAYRRGQIGWAQQTSTIYIANAKWTMVISYDHSFKRIVRPLIIFLFGVIMAALVIQLNRIQHRRLSALRVLAEQKAHHAEDRELIIGEMAHRLKNAFARVGALTRITSRESTSLADFETRFEGRLRALADTKQLMLTDSFVEFDLRQLIQRELSLAGWSETMRAGLSGPIVRLNEDGAQAIALVVHELVTNSIKYGALSGEGTLSVNWRRDGNRVELHWIETDLPATPRFDRESFGTQFIRSLIERQLKGSWHREGHDRQLSITIGWLETQSAAKAQ